MAILPEEFLNWNYYARRRLLEKVLKSEIRGGPEFFLEFTRHNPVLCTAAVDEHGVVEVNGKVVGVGYVVKEEYLKEHTRIFEKHLKETGERYEEVKHDETALKQLYREHAERGLNLLLKYIYLEPGKTVEVMDFEKLSSIELAKRLPHSSKHTWNLLQRNRNACLVFFQPPSISYEIKVRVSIHLDDLYHCFVTLIHDAYHYTPPQHREDRPVYIFHVLEVYDNSPTASGFGRRIV
ncbi:MAG: hypothetical protein DRJ37_00375 [Thermoprotei archaeon]|nr:MAG: hypothetical protein DRJ37_00375 [Thermoprotei archaeon]